MDAELEDLLIFSGSSCPHLAQPIATKLKMDLAGIRLGCFADGENFAELLVNVRGKNVFIIQSICRPANDNLMELMLIGDAARRSSAANIVAVAPYLGYSRQDRRPRSARVPISARVVADMLSGAGINRLMTMDLHSEQIQGFYNVPVDNVYASPVLMGDIAQRMENGNGLIISPDVGGVVRARAFANMLGIDLAIIDKRRPRDNVAKMMNLIGDVSGKDCFIVDDIVDTANTLCEAATALKNRGAKRVAAYCTHPVLSGEATSRICASDMDELVVVDTIPVDDTMEKCDKIRRLTVASILAEAISRVYRKGSLSSLFS